MRRFLMVMIAASLAGCSSKPIPTAPAVTLNVVKWADLEKVITSHQGKVVVLDVWAEY